MVVFIHHEDTKTRSLSNFSSCLCGFFIHHEDTKTRSLSSFPSCLRVFVVVFIHHEDTKTRSLSSFPSCLRVFVVFLFTTKTPRHEVYHLFLRVFVVFYSPRRHQDTKSLWFLNLKHHALDALFDNRHVEVDQEAQPFAGQF